MDAMLSALDQYMNRCAVAYEVENYIDDQMSKVKKNALRKLELIVHPNFTRDAAKALVVAYREDCAEAIRIFEELEYTDEEIYALEDDFERYKAHFTKNYKSEEPAYGYSY